MKIHNSLRLASSAPRQVDRTNIPTQQKHWYYISFLLLFIIPTLVDSVVCLLLDEPSWIVANYVLSNLVVNEDQKRKRQSW